MRLERPCGVVLFVIITVIVSVYSIRKELSAGKTLALLTLGASCSIAAAMLVFPMALTSDALAPDRVPGFFPIPFALTFSLMDKYGTLITVRLLAPGAALFAPIGLLLPVLGAPSSAPGARNMLPYAFAPIAIEACRLLECLAIGSFYKTVATDNILLAMTAVGLGYACNRAILIAGKSLKRGAAFGGQAH